MAERYFSTKCGECKQRAVALATTEYRTAVEHDGRRYVIVLPAMEIPRCGNCGAVVLDEEANRQISAVIRKEAGLLTPEQIRQARESLAFSQQELADLLGVAAATLSRWESGGQIQPRSLDRFMRAFFNLPQLRTALASDDALQLLVR